MRNKKLLRYTGIIFALLVVLFFTVNYLNQQDKPKPVKKKETVKGIQISTDFNTNSFSGKNEALMLKNLRLCDSTINWSEDLDKPSCTPNFFRVFPLKKGLDIAQGCMVLMKAGVNHYPERRFLVYEKEGNQMVQANIFVGYPIEFRPQPNNYDDVVIRFFEPHPFERNLYNCLFTWKQHRYQFVRCEQINDLNIKPEKQEQVSAEILKILNDKQLVF